MRILAGGQVLEDIDLYNRVHEMFNNLQRKVADIMIMQRASGMYGKVVVFMILWHGIMMVLLIM